MRYVEPILDLFPLRIECIRRFKKFATCIEFIYLLHNLVIMARLVKHEENAPMEIKVGDESKWICMCGLSKNKPFCDGNHKKAHGEEAGKLYVYNKETQRFEL